MCLWPLQHLHNHCTIDMMTPALACLLGEGTCLAASTRPKITLHPTQRLSGCRYAVKQTRTAVHAESTNGNATNSSATNGSASIELPSGEQQHVIQVSMKCIGDVA